MNICSLFSGAGGMDLGFSQAGFDIGWSNEFDKHIWATHELNFKNTILCKDNILDIKESSIPDCIGIIGGPPCQSFSEAGAKRGVNDPRGKLFWEYIRVLKKKKPLFFVAENVPGLFAARHEEDLLKFLKAFKDAGYSVSVEIYRASNYGVAQDRERVVFVGYRKDLNKRFNQPAKQSYKLVLKDVIAGMPEPMPTKNGQVSSNLLLPNHEYMTGGFSSMFMSRNRVRSWEESSFTILATARQIPLHPQAPKMAQLGKDEFKFSEGYEHLYRRLSVRECARIQSFPDDFLFSYNKIEDGYKMVGNAVPVELARQIALCIKHDLGL
jgi:DNA (cytosine-5)-methyltransferase 1